MTASYVGLLIEILLLGAGVYVYLYARGFIRVGRDAKSRAAAEAWRKDNATWMRFLGLALVALMAVNIVLHLREMF